MARTIRFHLDENVDEAVAVGLIRRGVDVTTTQQVGLGGATDQLVFSHCQQSGRVLFTSDKDFLRLHSSISDHNGVVYAHQQRISIGDAIRGLLLIWEILEPAEMAGRVEYL